MPGNSLYTPEQKKSEQPEDIQNREPNTAPREDAFKGESARKENSDEPESQGFALRGGAEGAHQNMERAANHVASPLWSGQ